MVRCTTPVLGKAYRTVVCPAKGLGMLFSSARQVGMDALQAVQAQGYNALAAMAMSSAAGAYSDQDAYNIERQALQAIANG